MLGPGRCGSPGIPCYVLRSALLAVCLWAWGLPQVAQGVGAGGGSLCLFWVRPLSRVSGCPVTTEGRKCSREGGPGGTVWGGRGEKVRHFN